MKTIKMSRKTHNEFLRYKLKMTHRATYKYGMYKGYPTVLITFKPNLLGYVFGVLILPIEILYAGLGEAKETFNLWKKVFITGYDQRDWGYYNRKEEFETKITYK